MYNLPYFKANNENEVIDFMKSHPFVVVTGVDPTNYPVATHVPVLMEEREGRLFLLAHIMKQTDHHKAFIQNPQVLVIFSGAHAYVSASWYKDQKQASTWNYQAVHAKGKLQFLPDSALLDILHRITEKFENNPSSPSLVNHLPTDYIDRLMKAIVAFEIEVTDIAHVFKMSQNRDKESYQNIIKHLSDGDRDAKLVASVMKENIIP
jgi:transcriptional regulator